MASDFFNPRKILSENLQLKKNMLAADLGCGSGEWVIALAQMLENGKVYAIDLLDEPLSSVRSQAAIKGLQNIEIVKSNVEKIISRLLSNSLDLVLMTNLLFQVDDREGVFKEAARILKSGGKVLVVDWNESARIGPEKKVSAEEIKKVAREAGFSLISEFPAGKFHFGIIFEKK